MRDLLVSFFNRRKDAIPAAASDDNPSAVVTPPETNTPTQECADPMNKHRQFPAAALSQSGLAPIEVAQLCVVHRNVDVQYAAEALRRELHQLVDASLLGFVAEASHRVSRDGAQLTAENVLATLQLMLADVAGEITAARDEAASHGAAIRHAMAPLQPLLSAVARRAAVASTERDALLRRVQGLSQGAPLSGAQRYQELARHLTVDQIAKLGIAQPDVDNSAAIAATRVRIAELDHLLAGCAAFHVRPGFNVDHLAGLGFDAEIEATRAAVGACAA